MQHAHHLSLLLPLLGVKTERLQSSQWNARYVLIAKCRDSPFLSLLSEKDLHAEQLSPKYQREDPPPGSDRLPKKFSRIVLEAVWTLTLASEA